MNLYLEVSLTQYYCRKKVFCLFCFVLQYLYYQPFSHPMLYIHFFLLVFLERVMALLPPQRKRPRFVRVSVVNRRDVLNKRTAVALSTAGWPDKTIRAIQSKQPDRFKASAASLSRHLKRQEGRGRLDSKPYSVARICALTCHELHTPKLHTRCKLLVILCSIYCANNFFMHEGFR